MRQAVTLQLLNQLCRKNIPCILTTLIINLKSIAYGLSNDAKILAKEDFNGISVWKQHFSNNLFSIVLIYSYPNTQTLTLIYCLNYVVGSGIDVLLWDFTVDALDEVAYRRLKDTLIWKC